MKDFWKKKKVLLTGHTGFKGSWLALWLQALGAEVYGYSLEPPTNPSLFELANVADDMQSFIGDVRDLQSLTKYVKASSPDIIFHLAAQSLVRKSYQDPVNTYTTNVVGTVNLFEAARAADCTRVIINITSDKCYDNKEWDWGYRENDALGGYDPYSSSKACTELITAAYQRSYFNDVEKTARTVLASVRAGNVIGGGDWAEDRLIPDIMRALLKKEKIIIRNPYAVRPWQHVLDSLYGYLLLARKLWDDCTFEGAWNFGPTDSELMQVGKVTEQLVGLWGNGGYWEWDQSIHPHETNVLKLDASKAKNKLGWRSGLTSEETLNWIVEWYQAYAMSMDIKLVTLNQIDRYQEIIAGRLLL